MKILLADDHALVRAGLKHVLQRIGNQPAEILEVTNYPQVFEALTAHNDIELIVLDLGMPGMSFLEGVNKIRLDYPTIALVVLSATEEYGVIKKAMGYGISGYLLKSSTNEVIINALRLVLAGGIYLPPVLLNSEGLNSSNTGIALTKKLEAKTLTARQREIVKLMRDGKSNKQIARALNITERTVKSHITSVFQTLRVSNRREALQHAVMFNLLAE